MSDPGPEMVAYLRARYDEAEAIARACLGVNVLARMISGVPCPRWVYQDGEISVTKGPSDPSTPVTGRTWDREAAHIVLNDPASVLADLAAKRAVLAEVERFLPVSTNPMTPAGVVVLAFVRVYAGRDDFPDEWRITK